MLCQPECPCLHQKVHSCFLNKKRMNLPKREISHHSSKCTELSPKRQIWTNSCKVIIHTIGMQYTLFRQHYIDLCVHWITILVLYITHLKLFFCLCFIPIDNNKAKHKSFTSDPRDITESLQRTSIYFLTSTHTDIVQAVPYSS